MESSTIRPGVLLSGDKLVDNIDYRTQLISFETEAIGGEMEGAGMYVGSNEHKVDWIVIKAICDWGDGQKAKNKTARQKKAAKAAAQFVLHALKHAPIVSLGAQPEDTKSFAEGHDEPVIDLKDILVGMRGSASGPVSIMSDWVMPMYEGIGIVAACYFALNAALTAPSTEAVVAFFRDHIRPSARVGPES